MKKLIIAAALMTLITAAGAGESTTTLRIRELQKEYAQTAQQVRSGQEHLLRLEGAISILQQMENRADDEPTTFTTSNADIPSTTTENVPD